MVLLLLTSLSENVLSEEYSAIKFCSMSSNSASSSASSSAIPECCDAESIVMTLFVDLSLSSFRDPPTMLLNSCWVSKPILQYLPSVYPAMHSVYYEKELFTVPAGCKKSISKAFSWPPVSKLNLGCQSAQLGI
jgi:hypothetical protein